jgi:hypothetical protein
VVLPRRSIFVVVIGEAFEYGGGIEVAIAQLER